MLFSRNDYFRSNAHQAQWQLPIGRLWTTWATGAVENVTGILNICVRGPVDTFAEQWPHVMQQSPDPKARGAITSKTP